MDERKAAASDQLARDLVSELKTRHNVPPSDTQPPTVRAAAERLLQDFREAFEYGVVGSAAAVSSPAPSHIHALQRANEVRFARAELKRKVAEGSIAVSDILLTCPWEAAGMTVSELLVSQRRWGTARSRKFLAAIGVPETKTIGSMTERQRHVLATMM
jgi:hypothetical protein